MSSSMIWYRSIHRYCSLLQSRQKFSLW